MKIVKLNSAKNSNHYYKLLINSGITHEQADAIIDVIKYAERDKDSAFATKNDIQKLHYLIEKLEMKLIIKLGAMMAFWSSVILTVIKSA